MSEINIYSVGGSSTAEASSVKSSPKNKKKKYKGGAGKKASFRKVSLFGTELLIGPYIYVSRYLGKTYIMVKKNLGAKDDSRVYSSVSVSTIEEARNAVQDASKLLGYLKEYKKNLKQYQDSLRSELGTTLVALTDTPSESTTSFSEVVDDATSPTEKSLIGDLLLIYKESLCKLEEEVSGVIDEKDKLCASIVEPGTAISPSSIVGIVMGIDKDSDFAEKFRALNKKQEEIESKIKGIKYKVETLDSFLK